MSWKNVQYENGKFKTGSGGGGGASALTDLSDVNISSASDGQVLKYDSTSSKWVNANESGGGGHTYSTTEQVVGTWIDGKPLYERVFETNYTTIQNDWVNTGIDASGMSKIISCIGHCYGEGYMFLSTFDEAQLYNNMVRICVGANGSGRTYNLVILQYTKTTD